jgi:hypothetical protein
MRFLPTPPFTVPIVRIILLHGDHHEQCYKKKNVDALFAKQAKWKRPLCYRLEEACSAILDTVADLDTATFLGALHPFQILPLLCQNRCGIVVHSVGTPITVPRDKIILPLVFQSHDQKCSLLIASAAYLFEMFHICCVRRDLTHTLYKEKCMILCLLISLLVIWLPCYIFCPKIWLPPIARSTQR